MARFAILLLVPFLAGAQNPSGPARFETHVLASDLRGGYQVVAADLNHDGKLDLIALGQGMGELVWFENPTWERHVLATGVSQMVNCVVLDGAKEIVLASGFSQRARDSQGIVSVLRPEWRRAPPVDGHRDRSSAHFAPPAPGAHRRRPPGGGERSAHRRRRRAARLQGSHAAGLLPARRMEAAPDQRREHRHRARASHHGLGWRRPRRNPHRQLQRNPPLPLGEGRPVDPQPVGRRRPRAMAQVRIERRGRGQPGGQAIPGSHRTVARKPGLRLPHVGRQVGPPDHRGQALRRPRSAHRGLEWRWPRRGGGRLPRPGR